MNSHNTSTGLQRYGQTIAAGLLKFFAGNINAQLQNPEPSELEAVTPIESPLKFVREISIDQYMSERLNWIRLMDMVTHAEGKRNNPRYGKTTVIGDIWIKHVKGQGYFTMWSDESGRYIFLFDKPPTEVDFVSMYSNAKLVGRSSQRLDALFGIKKL